MAQEPAVEPRRRSAGDVSPGVCAHTQVAVDDRELRRDGPTYTIDTLHELRAEHPGAELFLQIGADQAAAFHTWRRADEILQIATLSIAVRAYV